MNMMNRGKYSGDMALLTPIEQKEYETKGYAVLKEETIRCGNCRRGLLDIIKVKEDESIIKEVKVNCPFCGDESFVYRITGHTYMQAFEGVSIQDMPMDIVDNVMKMNIEVIKNE